MTTTNDTTTTDTTIARTFADLLRKHLTRQEWRAMGDANYAETDPHVCHSHDYCDANLVMYDAFHQHGIDINAANDDDCARWSRVWNVAMPMLTRVPCPTVYPERTSHYADGHTETRHNVACDGSLSTCAICGARRYCGFEARCLDGDTPAHIVRRHFDIEEAYRDAFGAPLAGWTRGERWNGWACPRFELAEARRIADWNNDAAGDWRFTFDEATATFTLHDANYEGEEPERFEPFTLETTDGPRVVYAMGAWAWCWDEVPETRDDDEEAR